MVGGDDYATRPFNLATQGQRQPGSAFKPFVLAQALEQRHLARLDVGLAQDATSASRARRASCIEYFDVNNYEDAYAGVTHAAHAPRRSPTTPSTRSSASRSVRARSPGWPRRIGHPHARLAQPRDDARRPASRASRRSTWRTPTRRSRSGGRLTYGTMSPGAGRPRTSSAPPCPGPVGIQTIGRRDDGKLKPVKLPNGEKAENEPRELARAEAAVADDGRPRCSATVVASGTGDARADLRRVRRRQDGHDRELRRRLVRRLDATRSRSRCGSAIPDELQADGDRVQRRAGRRRHLSRRRSGRRSWSARARLRGVRARGGGRGRPTSPVAPGADRPRRRPATAAAGRRRRPRPRTAAPTRRGRRHRARARGTGAGGAPAEPAPEPEPPAAAERSAPPAGAARTRAPARRGRRRTAAGPATRAPQRPAATGRETLREPAAQKRHSSSAAFVIPIRVPVTTSTSSQPGGRGADPQRPAERGRCR